jgi:hypothetical protein
MRGTVPLSVRQEIEQCVVDTVVEVARPEILRVFSADSCVASARIALDVFAYFGIAAKPVPVSVAVFNADAYDLLEREGSLDAVAVAVMAYEPSFVGGPWTIGMGAQGVPDRPVAAGHVVVGLPTLGQFVDLSLDQVSRPVKNIVLSASAFPVDPASGFLMVVGAKEGYAVGQETGGPVRLLYTHEPQHLYKGSPNWQRSTSQPDGRQVFKEVTRNVLREVKRQVAVVKQSAGAGVDADG